MKRALLMLVLLSSCSQSSSSLSPTRWILIEAPYLLNKETDTQPCQGSPYLRAPIVDWTRDGEYESFQKCAAAINEPKPDPNPELHRQGKLSDAEKLLGFRCVLSTDPGFQLAKYDWRAEAAK